MSELLPRPPSDLSHEFQPTSWQDARWEKEEARDRWQVRAAQWGALELARAVFGQEARARLSRSGPGQAFRGLLYLEVPFRSLEDHRLRESVFLACARRDLVMVASPLIFVFEPNPVGRPL